MMAGRAVVAAVSAWLLVAAGSAAKSSNSCGAERRDVKSGFDDGARSIDASNATPSTVAELAAKDAPNPIPDSRTADAETTVWTVDATLTSFKLETDSDYHLVLDDGAGNTMIAEIPSPDCIAQGNSAFGNQISSARGQLDAQFTATSQFQDADVPVHVTGVGLFDFSHGQRGFAANGIELHPVLDIQFKSAGGAESGEAPSLLAATSRPATGPLHLWTAMRMFQQDEAEGGGNAARTWRASGGAGVAATAAPAPTGAPAGTAPPPSLIAPRSGAVPPAASPAPAFHRGAVQAKLATGGGRQQVMVQDLEIPAGVSDAMLRFAIHVSSNIQERRTARLRIQVRDPRGKRPTSSLQAYSNLDANPGFDDQSFDLSRFRGQRVRIAFVASGQAGTLFTIDDARLAMRK